MVEGEGGGGVHVGSSRPGASQGGAAAGAARSGGGGEPAGLPPLLVVYDGTCGFCDKSVQRLLDWDREGRLRFTALQGDTFQPIHARHPTLDPQRSMTLVIQDGAGERTLTHSGAMFEICRHLPWPWRMLSWFEVLPRALTDRVYLFISDHRYLIGGQREACRLPTPEERGRFLP